MKKLSWKILLFGGLLLDIIARFLQDNVLFQALGVLGDIMFLLGLVNLITILIKKRRAKKDTSPNTNSNHGVKKNLIIGILSLLLLLSLWKILSTTEIFTSQINSEKSVKKYYSAIGLSDSGEITCTYPQTLMVNYLGDEITHQLPKPETNPMIFTFSNMIGDEPKLKFIDATRTISEIKLTKILDSADKYIFIEGTGDPYITVHTIYKKTGISIFSKQSLMLGIPIGTLSMGTCFGN